MKKIKITLVLAIALMAMQVIAQPVVISAAEFMSLVKNDKSLVIIDADKASNFEVTHIKNAINVPHMELYKEPALDGYIKDVADLAAYFGKKGISESATIVITDDGSQKYSSRVYWILKYLGAKNVRLLHKDLDTWRAARVPLTAMVTDAKATSFTPAVNTEIIVDYDHVKNSVRKEGVVIVDSRLAEEFDGTSEAKPSLGHLPGAVNLNHLDLLNEKGAFKTKASLEALAAEKGLTADKEIIFYCKTSVRAAVAYVAFAEILQYPHIKIYEGAYNEWVALDASSIEK